MEENNSRSTEVKVGLFTLIGLAIIIAIAMFVGKIELGGPKGYDLKVFFTSADGLAVGNQVRYAGIRAGRVEQIELLPQGIQVVLRIDPGVKVPEESIFTLGTEGLMGSRYVAIQPPEHPGDRYLKPGTRIRGLAPPSIDDMMESLTSLVRQVEDVVKNVNDIAGAPETKASLKMAIINMGIMSENLRLASESLNRLSYASENDVRVIVQNMRIASDDMRDMISKISDDGKGGEDIRQMLKDMRSILTRMDNITASIEELATDPQTVKDLQATLRNANEASAKINRLLGGNSKKGDSSEVYESEIDEEGVQKVKTKPTGKTSRSFFEGGVDFSYSPDERDWRGDANVTLGGDRFIRIGAQDIGEDNNFEFQAGTWRGPVAFRAGVFESKLGAGIDWQIADWWKVSVDGYDPNDFKYRLRSEFDLTKDGNLSLIAQMYGRRRATSTYFGIRQSF